MVSDRAKVLTFDESRKSFAVFLRMGLPKKHEWHIPYLFFRARLASLMRCFAALRASLAAFFWALMSRLMASASRCMRMASSFCCVICRWYSFAALLCSVSMRRFSAAMDLRFAAASRRSGAPLLRGSDGAGDCAHPFRSGRNRNASAARRKKDNPRTNRTNDSAGGLV